MAFIDIKNPEKREEIVQDYIKNLREVREKTENDKVQGLTQSREIAKVFQPVVQATEKSATQISSEIKNLKNEENESQENIELSPALKYYFNDFSKNKLDQYFSIQKDKGKLYMGNKEVIVDEENNIHIDDVVIKGTFGLWRLIMMKTPENYEPEDFENYKELLNRTKAIENPRKRGTADRPLTTAKFTFFKENKLVQTGTGIQFLPGDIKGLLSKLRLLSAEAGAGNKASIRNQIVGILDELLRRKFLTQEEYNAVCEKIC